MKLVYIIGSGAVGKMTVGQELAKITDLKLFHNHMMIEPVLEIFGDFNGQVISKLRQTIFEEFAKSENYGLIFTYLWAFDMPSDWDYINNLTALFEKNGAEVYCIELVASKDIRLYRNGTENRLKYKASKRDVEASNQRLLSEENYRTVSFDGEIPFKNYIRIDNTNISAAQAAKMIKEKFDL
ncbi:MAG: shikimate kinase [Clostridia bacterium]|nr:shikimate kinase [Clostridia bacterium]